MPRVGVVFDTNVYRQLSDEQLATLAESERGLSIQPIASYFVAIEMLAHVSGDERKQQQIALRSLARYWRHAKTYDGSAYVLNFVHRTHDQLAWLLFGIQPQNPKGTGLGSVIGQIVNDPGGRSIAGFAKGLETIAADVTRIEDDFVQDLWQRAVLTLAPSASSWSDVTSAGSARNAILARIDAGGADRLIAEAFVRGAADSVDVSLDEQDVAVLARKVAVVFSIPILLVQRLIRHIIDTGVDMTLRKRANTYWDVHIAFSTGVGVDIGGVPIWLITDDRAIQRAASDASAEYLVKTLPDYLSLLELRDGEFQRLLARSRNLARETLEAWI